MPERKVHAHFIEPMLLLRSDTLPTGQNWAYELKFDGFRAETIKSDGKVHLRLRNDKDFNGRGAGPCSAVGRSGGGPRAS